MLYGNKARFGIEFELNENPGGAWMFGKFCYWIGGEQVGDFYEVTSLRDVLFAMKYIVGDTGRRTAPSLASCDGRDAFHIIRDYLNEASDDLAKLIPTDSMPACFDVCPPIDIFGTWHIYLVDAREISKIVCSSDGGNSVKTVDLALGEFDAVALDTCSKLSSLLEAYS
ncbi:Imm42 family immunity protein [Burkholderia sp. Ac-20379]|uniref:Imm42 family immunity protein n=1 Tax=Burkholderia sp. Ac-20379 TaxID=2703900 RepID=UPI00197FBBA4|nr:Imm42 family immunity protein [Burkholderia sp. Ac-20379]MBN3724242.1 hypothetical protein [Burkholderia sp. Ac-20379]